MQGINNPNHPVILFIPEAGIYPFTRGLAVLGDAVQKNGGRVFVTHDTGQMLRSPIMAMYNTSVNISENEKDKIYNVTERHFKSVLKNYSFSSIELSSLIDNKLEDEINFLVNERQKDLRKIYFRGFPVGKMAEFDFVLETKFPYSLNLSAAHKNLYLQYIKNTALSLALTDRICKFYKPSLLLTFNEYAQCQAVRYSANKHNVRFMALTYPVHLNIDASRFLIWESTYRLWRSRHCQNWNSWKDVPIDSKNVIACWEDGIFRMYNSGSHIFSSRKKNNPEQIFTNLKLDLKRKTIIVYTSSQDERITGDISMEVWNEQDNTHDVFRNQLEWLLWLRDYAAKQKDIQVIVRIHPREGNRQNGSESKHMKLLKTRLKKISSNFVVIWPDNPISSYDLMELADVCLVAWSLMGLEAARVGIPVLSPTANMFYPNEDFIQTASTLKEYKRKLDAILKMDYTWQHLTKAIRFYNWRTFIPSLDLGKIIPADFDDKTVWPKVPQSMVKIINNILSGKEDLIKYNINKWQKSLPTDAINREKRAMKRGIRFFLDKLYYPDNNRMDLVFRVWRYVWRRITGNNLWIPPQRVFKDYHLKYIENASQLGVLIKKTINNSKLRILVRSGSEAILINRGRILRRMSPMAIRLARLHEDN